MPACPVRPERSRRDASLRSASPLGRQAARVDPVERIVADIAEEIRVAARKAARVFGDEAAGVRVVPSGPVIRETGLLVNRAAGIAKRYPDARAWQRRGAGAEIRGPRKDLPKAVVLPVLDDLPAVSRVPRNDVADRALMIGKRPERARRTCRDLIDRQNRVAPTP